MLILSKLRAHPILGQARPESLAWLAERSDLKTYDPGDVACRAGRPQRNIMVLLSGALRLYRRNKAMETEMLVGIMKAPAVFGDAELYARAPWTISGVAVEPVDAVLVPNEAYDAFIEAEGKVAAAMYRDSCARHALVVEIMQIFGLQSTQNQVLRLLIRQAAADQTTGDPLTVPLHPVALARSLGVNRKTVARKLKELEDLGYIARQGDRVTLHIPEEYRRMAELPEASLGAVWKLPSGA